MTATVSADEFADRMFQASLSTLDVLATYVGDRLGWYRALASGGPATAAELVQRAGGDIRYAKEWLEQQAAWCRRNVGWALRLPPGRLRSSPIRQPLHLAPLARMLSAAAKAACAMSAYREAAASAGATSRYARVGGYEPALVPERPALRLRPTRSCAGRTLVADVAGGLSSLAWPGLPRPGEG
jgi:hypothetical protein